MALTPAQISELLIAARTHIAKDELVFDQMDLQEYMVLDWLMANGKEYESGGTSWQVPIITGSPQNSRVQTGGIDTPFNVQIGHDSKYVNISPSYMWGGYGIYEEEIRHNSGAMEHIYDLLSAEFNSGWSALYSQVENFGMGFRAATDANNIPFGLFNFIVFNATKGFTGDTASGYNDTLGVSSDDKWKNFSLPYTEVSADDLLIGLAEMKMRTMFKAPGRLRMPDGSLGGYRRVYLMSKSPYLALRQLNDTRIDKDVALDVSGEESLTILGNPAYWVPQFDGEYSTAGTVNSGSDPILQVDLNYLVFPFLSGFKFAEYPESKDPEHPTLHRFPIRSVYNMYVNRRRCMGIAAKSAPV